MFLGSNIPARPECYLRQPIFRGGRIVRCKDARDAVVFEHADSDIVCIIVGGGLVSAPEDSPFDIAAVLPRFEPNRINGISGNICTLEFRAERIVLADDPVWI